MKLIESKAEYIPQATVPSGSPEGILEGIYKQIELAGRTCYKSLDKVTDSSAKPFVDRMISSKHTAMLEHGTVYLRGFIDVLANYHDNKYSKTKINGNYLYVTTNLRVLVENNWLDDLKYLCLPTEHHKKRYTFKFTTDRGISHELVRHRTFSFAQESQRYCNYSNAKYGNELTFILPSWLINTLKTGHYELCTHDNEDGEIIGPDYTENVYTYTAENIFVKECLRSELQYLNLVNDLKYSPQQARAILPNATKTELVMTGFSSDWKFLMDLRLFERTGKVHPDMLNLTQKAQKAMQEAGIWEDIMSNPSKFE